MAEKKAKKPSMKKLMKKAQASVKWFSQFSHRDYFFPNQDFRKEYQIEGGGYAVSDLVDIRDDLQKRLDFVNAQIEKETKSAQSYNQMLEQRRRDIGM